MIGVDASHYLDLRLNNPPNGEPLLNAVGGDPYTLKASLRDDLQAFQAVDATLIFVFNGLDYKNKELSNSPKSSSTLKAHKDGWKEYYNKDNGRDVAAERTLKAFAKASTRNKVYIRSSADIYPRLSSGESYQVFSIATRPVFCVIHRRSIQCGCAGTRLARHIHPFITDRVQLAYLERGVSRFKQERVSFIDAIIGSADLFLFNVERVITSFSTRQGLGTFDALSRSACQDRLDKASDDVFRDVQLLLGGPFLPTFPPLDKSGGPKVNARDAVNMLNTTGRSVIQLCNQYRDDQIQAMDYEDKYKRAILSLRHHVVLDKDGKATTMGSEYGAGDAHEIIGLRLPEELYFYISLGMIDPRVPNWLTRGEIDLVLPAGCEDIEAYRVLLGEQLTSLQTQTICLLSNSMNRFYQSRIIRIKTWYSRDSTKSINVKEEPSVREMIAGWRVPETSFNDPAQAASVGTCAS